MNDCQSLIENERRLVQSIEPLVLKAEDVDPPMAEVYGELGDVVRFYNGAREWAEGSLKGTLKEAMTASASLRRFQMTELRNCKKAVLESEARVRELQLKIALTHERYAQAALPYDW